MKVKGLFFGSILGVFIAIAFAGNVKAVGMPCTEAEIKKAQELKAVADQELAVAIANKNQADLNVIMLKSQGIGGVELLLATDTATNAANIVRDYQGKVANAQKYIDELISRANTEQYQLDMEAKWKNRAQLDLLKMQLDAAIPGTPAYNQLSAQYNALYNSGTWATNEDNANYDRFVRNYGTNLEKTYTIPGQNGQPDTKIGYYCPDKPNEWSIRWFE